MGDKLIGNENGVDDLIAFMDGIYKKDDMANVWRKYSEFTDLKRKKNQEMDEFLSEWKNAYHKA